MKPYSKDLRLRVLSAVDSGKPREEVAKTREALVESIGRALAAVTAEDAAGWFAHAGYWPQAHPL